MAILSVKFSLFEKSTTYATEFASTLKCGPYLGEFETYNPNAWSKKSCDPDYTDISGPCRGTSETCGFTDDTIAKTAGHAGPVVGALPSGFTCNCARTQADS